VADNVRVALVVPVSGTLGLIGPGAINCSALAAQEINDGGGLLRRRVELTLVAVPYVYTPPYEGGERSPGVYLAGETPDRQVQPVVAWLAERNRGRRWFLLGNDYVWPRRVHASARAYLKAVGAAIVDERYVRRGELDPEPLLDAVADTRADAVLVTLIGRDLVDFNRAFAASPLAERVFRLCPALEENGLLGVGGDGTGELYSTMGCLDGHRFRAELRRPLLGAVRSARARAGRPWGGLLRRHVAARGTRVPGRLSGHTGA
jgi:ABC-type branched-subunit amino acid transport system substrate-binding protein